MMRKGGFELSTWSVAQEFLQCQQRTRVQSRLPFLQRQRSSASNGCRLTVGTAPPELVLLLAMVPWTMVERLIGAWLNGLQRAIRSRVSDNPRALVRKARERKGLSDLHNLLPVNFVFEQWITCSVCGRAVCWCQGLSWRIDAGTGR